MDSRKWMDLDGPWVYSTAPRKHPESYLGYNTLPGRKSKDIVRRPADERGMYGTIPGRFVDRAPMGEQTPYKLRSFSRLPHSPILQDSTNWPPSLPPGARGPKLLRMEQKNEAKERESGKYDGRIYERVRHSDDLERKKRKLLREAEAEIVNISSDKHRRKGKPMEWGIIYEQPDYSRYQKMKITQCDDWEPLSLSSKALQVQSTSQIKLPLSKPHLHKEKVTETKAPDQEKRRWWFKSQKQQKTVSDVMAMGNNQDESYKRCVEQCSVPNYNIHALQGSKENQPKLRKRKGPPPYVPPPSYNAPHHTFLISKDEHIHTEQTSAGEIIPLTDKDNGKLGGEKVARYTVEHQVDSNLTFPSFSNVNRGQEEKKHKSAQIYQKSIWDRTLPQLYSTWGGERSKSNLNQISSNYEEFLDHIYETVDRGSSPLNHNVPGEKTYGTLSNTRQIEPSTKYTLPRSGINDVTKTTKKNKIVTNCKPQKMALFDVYRPPIRSHGVKLPHELGFSYTSEKPHYTDKKLRSEYRSYHNLQEEDTVKERQRPLRVISKERTGQSHINSFPMKEEYSRYSQTLPLKKDPYLHIKADMQERIPTVHSRKNRNINEDIAFPKWREPGKFSTIPGRGHNHILYRPHDGLHRSVKYDLPDPSETNNWGTPRKGQLKEATSEKTQPPLLKENEGMFVIDATCVVVKAEYIFPPRTEQVKFLSYPEVSPGLMKRDIQSNRKIYFGSTEPKPNLNYITHLSPPSQKAESTSDHFNHQSHERDIPNLKERAMRILGLSMVDLESLNEDHTLHITNKMVKQEAELLNKTLREHNKNGGHKHNTCTGASNSMTVDVKDSSYKSLCPVEEDEHQPSFIETSLDSNLIEENRQMESEQNIATCSTESNCKETDPATSNLVPYGLEANKPIEMEPCRKYESVLNQNDITLFEMEVETLQEKDNCSELFESPCQDDVSGCLDLQVSINRQPLDNTNSNDSVENILKTVERPEQNICGLKDVDEIFTKTCVLNGNNCENSEKVNPNKYAEHSKKTPYVTGSPQPVSPRVKHDSQVTSEMKNHLSDQTYSPRTPVKTFTKRHNYFAKDLREAVSRIRRHTAPDSDTDEDLEKPLPLRDSCSEMSEDHMGEEGIVSCSSDTSDSEVTVILRVADKVELISEINTNYSQDFAETEGSLNGFNVTKEDTMLLDSTKGDFSADEIGNTSDNDLIHEKQQESKCMDLNSCIEEILQDLNRTEEEFFPSSSDYCTTDVTTASLEHLAE
ncbi:uncharacterized protein LOC134595789 [Pelobates fuscus]|uniref:uncharacterized protein LOC134595789 n=1 Tax=Pelobates fuscus TaxID=191477 RepID=UPI002FE49B34